MMELDRRYWQMNGPLLLSSVDNGSLNLYR